MSDAIALSNFVTVHVFGPVKYRQMIKKA